MPADLAARPLEDRRDRPAALRDPARSRRASSPAAPSASTSSPARAASRPISASSPRSPARRRGSPPSCRRSPAARGPDRARPREPDAADRPHLASPRRPTSPPRSTRCSTPPWRSSSPSPARAALDALRAADAETRRWLLANVLADDIPVEDAAPAPLRRRRGAGPRRPPRRHPRRRPARADPRPASAPAAAAGPPTSLVVGSAPHRGRPLRRLRHLRDALERGPGEVPRLRLDQGHRLPRRSATTR